MRGPFGIAVVCVDFRKGVGVSFDEEDHLGEEVEDDGEKKNNTSGVIACVPSFVEFSHGVSTSGSYSSEGF